jgi:hypothetical protein
MGERSNVYASIRWLKQKQIPNYFRTGDWCTHNFNTLVFYKHEEPCEGDFQTRFRAIRKC